MTVVKCAHLARDMNYEYFAVQDRGGCWTDKNIVYNYYKYGSAPPENCVGGVGASYTNFVYRIKAWGISEYFKKPPLNFNAYISWNQGKNRLLYKLWDPKIQR